MKLQVRFDGPPGPVCGRFVEVEDEHGRSICAGEWKQDGEFWLLVIDTDQLETTLTPPPTPAEMALAKKVITRIAAEMGS